MIRMNHFGFARALFLSGCVLLDLRCAGRAADLNVPDRVVFERAIEYSNPDGQHLQLDLARPKNPGVLSPAVLCIHGGGFRAGSREGYDGLCVRLAEHGFVAATVTYRLAPKYPFPAA